VGASFAVLVAEELLASGCTLVVSLTSADQISGDATPPYFVLIERALHDEGTSYHHMAPSRYAAARPMLLERLEGALAGIGQPIHRGSSGRRRAPRETPPRSRCDGPSASSRLRWRRPRSTRSASARGYVVVCFAHVTNQMGQTDLDFEKAKRTGRRMRSG